jgi:glycogen(starch) synthase
MQIIAIFRANENNTLSMTIQEDKPLLVEVAWEVCNQVGGIYTVIRTKIPAAVDVWKGNYCLIGPYIHPNVQAEFESSDDYENPIGRAVLKMRQTGFEVYYGYWLVTGRPRVVLLSPYSVYHKMGDIKFELWDHHQISTPTNVELIDQVIGFGYLAKEFFRRLADGESTRQPLLAHFHEWMAGTPIPEIRYLRLPVTMVFTTHATLLGRYLAMNDPEFYNHLPFTDWAKEAKHFNIEPSVAMERAAAHGAQVFTTVSDVTGEECIHLLGRKIDSVTPNGLNVERFVALHEFQNLHLEHKRQIHKFTMGHFFHNYKFNLDKTLYFFTSGRYEYRNKGFDLTLEALARLNGLLRLYDIDITVVMFFITKRPYHSINPSVLQTRALLEEIKQTCDAITRQIGDNMFMEVAAGTSAKLPPLENFIEDYWRLRLRRTVQSWKTKNLPIVVTHNLVDDANDDILRFLRTAQLVNNPYDKVKIVYHPDFISPASPLFGMEYNQFVRGCHLGIFPSYYEPWGYTPLECMASGVPSVTSDLSGFGDYVMKHIPDAKEREDKGIYLVNRYNRSFNDAANQLAEQMFAYVQKNRRERIAQRNKVEAASVDYDWKRLYVHYERAYQLALDRR